MKKFSMRIAKKYLLALGISVTAIQGAQAIVVYDPTAVSNLVKQLSQMKQQYEVLKKQYSAVTGNSGIGTTGVKGINDIVSGSWQDIVANQKAGAFGSAQKAYDKVLTTIGSQGMNELMSNDQYKRNFDTVKASFAFSDVAYSALNEHLANLKTLQSKVGSTQSLKDSQDLANAISIEQSYISSITGKLSAVQTNLASNSASRNVTSTQSYKSWFE